MKEYLRPEDPESVDLLESKGDGQELMVQIRGYRTGEVEVGDASIGRSPSICFPGCEAIPISSSPALE